MRSSLNLTPQFYENPLNNFVKRGDFIFNTGFMINGLADLMIKQFVILMIKYLKFKIF
jgi:hypothetical protein